MGKSPSDATMLRTAKSEIARLNRSYSTVYRANQYAMARAVKAEKELAEWKARFDILLKMTQKGAGNDG